MAELTLTHWTMFAIAGAAALVAGFIRGFTGFGGPAILLLTLTHFYNPSSVVPKVMLIDLIANLALAYSVASEASWRTTGILIAASCAAFPFGIYALLVVDPMIMKRVIAVVIGACVLIVLAGWRYQRPPATITLIGAGALAGVVFGATYVALVAAIFLFAGPDSAVKSRANTIVWGCVLAILTGIGYGTTGTITVSDLWRTAIVGIAYGIAAFAGARLFRGAAESVVRRVVLWLLLVLSVAGALT